MDDAGIEKYNRSLFYFFFFFFLLAYITSSTAGAFFFADPSNACIFHSRVSTHIGLHLLDRPIERVGHLPRRHDRQIDSQQYPDHHE